MAKMDGLTSIQTGKEEPKRKRVICRDKFADLPLSSPDWDPTDACKPRLARTGLSESSYLGMSVGLISC